MSEPAYPLLELHQVTGQVCAQHFGLTMRDYFAASVQVSDDLDRSFLEALTGRARPDWRYDPIGVLQFDAEVRAKLRYIEADAMLKAREEQPK